MGLEDGRPIHIGRTNRLAHGDNSRYKSPPMDGLTHSVSSAVPRSPRSSALLFGEVATLAACVIGWILYRSLRESVQSVQALSAVWFGFWIFTPLAAFLSSVHLLTGGSKLDGARFQDPRNIVLSRREQFRVAALICATCGGALVMALAMWFSSLPKYLPAVGYGGWLFCAFQLMTGGWQEWLRKESKLLLKQREEEQQQHRRDWFAWLKRSAFSVLDQRQQPRTLRRRFALEWLWLFGCVGLSVIASQVLPSADYLEPVIVGAVGGLLLYVVSVVIRVTIWSIVQVFGRSTGVQQ